MKNHFKQLLIIGFCIAVLFSCKGSSTDEKFVGQWCYCSTKAMTNSDTTQPQHCILAIKKMDNTAESYSFNMSYIFTLNETFTREDENTLKSVDGTGDKLFYVDSTRHILLISHDGSTMEFNRLK